MIFLVQSFLRGLLQKFYGGRYKCHNGAYERLVTCIGLFYRLYGNSYGGLNLLRPVLSGRTSNGARGPFLTTRGLIIFRKSSGIPLQIKDETNSSNDIEEIN